MRFLWVLIPAFYLGCEGGRIPEGDCQSICGSETRLELVIHECGRIGDPVDVETCRLSAIEAFETCHSRCE